MWKFILQFGLTGILLAGCSSISVRREALSPSQVNASPAHYDGKFVVVRGFVELGPETHILYESQSLSAKVAKQADLTGGKSDVTKYNGYCLTIANPALLLLNRRTINRKTIIVKGKFVADYLNGTIIDLGACALPTAIVIDYADLERRYGPLLPNR